MLKTKKTGKGSYSTTFIVNIEELDRARCFTIKKDLSPHIKSHSEIIIDVKGVKSINNGGYRILHELTGKAHTKKCQMKFINVEPQVSAQISKLTVNMVTPLVTGAE